MYIERKLKKIIEAITKIKRFYKCVILFSLDNKKLNRYDQMVNF